MKYFAHVVTYSSAALEDPEALVLAVDPSVPGGSRVVDVFQLDYTEGLPNALDRIHEGGWNQKPGAYTKVSPGYFVVEVSKA